MQYSVHFNDQPCPDITVSVVKTSTPNKQSVINISQTASPKQQFLSSEMVNAEYNQCCPDMVGVWFIGGTSSQNAINRACRPR